MVVVLPRAKETIKAKKEQTKVLQIDIAASLKIDLGFLP